MKRLIIILFILLNFSPAFSADYYVDNTGGSDSANGDIGTPWETIAKANSTLVADDTVYIRAGRYKESIHPDNSGTSGNYITYQNYNGEVVLITGVDGDSIPKDGNGDNITVGVDGILISNRSYIIIDGFQIKNVDYFAVIAPNGHHNIIQNCLFQEGTHFSGIDMIGGADYNKILNNIMIAYCEPHDIIQLRNSEYNLFQGNEFYYGSHNAIAILDTDEGETNYNIFKGNIIQNFWHSNVGTYGVEYLLFEDNIILDGGEYAANNSCGSVGDRNMPREEHKGLMTNARYSIMRRNVMVNNGFGLGLSSSTTDYKAIGTDNMYYNNTIIGNVKGIRSATSIEKVNLMVKNNIIYNNIASEISVGGNTNSISYINNNIGGTGTRYGVTSGYISDNVSLDPGFINETGRDYNLRSDSLMVDAGAFLTLASGSGSGTSLPVDDARYFIDGWGIIAGDLIQLQGQTETARVTNVNYSTNTLTLDTSLTWTDNIGVSLAYAGTSPDIGAFESGYTSPEDPEDPPDPPDPPASPVSEYIEGEDMDLTSPMVAVADIEASGGYYISPTTGINTTSPAEEATYDIIIADAGTYYLWVSISGEDVDSNAMYAGIGATWARFYARILGAYEWQRVPINDGSSVYGFELAAATHTIRLGHGETNAKIDLVWLTSDPDDIPTIPYTRYIEVEDMDLISPMAIVDDIGASNGKYVKPNTGEDSESPVAEATYDFTVAEAGEYYMWLYIKGEDSGSNALYVGIDTTWNRVFTSVFYEYRWRPVQVTDSSGDYSFTLTAGTHTVRIGHGEVDTHADLIFISSNPDATPEAQFIPAVGVKAAISTIMNSTMME